VVSVPKENITLAEDDYFSAPIFPPTNNRKLAVFYLNSGIRKNWNTHTDIFSGSTQKSRKIDGNGDLWEWCYRFTSVINYALDNIDPSKSFYAYPSAYSGWGWYKMMNVNTGYVYNQPDDVIDGDGNQIDGVPYANQEDFLNDYAPSIDTSFTDESTCNSLEMNTVTITFDTDFFYFPQHGMLPDIPIQLLRFQINNDGEWHDVYYDGLHPQKIMVPKYSDLTVVAVFNWTASTSNSGGNDYYVGRRPLALGIVGAGITSPDYISDYDVSTNYYGWVTDGVLEGFNGEGIHKKVEFNVGDTDKDLFVSYWNY